MEIELMSELHAHFEIPLNIGRIIHQSLAKTKKGDIVLDDFCNVID